MHSFLPPNINTANIILLLFVILTCPGCLITMKTARITPIATSSHTIAAELMSEDFMFDEDMAPNIRYMFRRGLTERFEGGFNAELVNPHLGLGGKYGITRWCALDVNAGLSMGIFGNFFPTADAAVIFGEQGLYGGLKYELFADDGYNPAGAIHPFIGYEKKTRGKLRILYEFCLGSVAVKYTSSEETFYPFEAFAWYAGIGFAF